MSLEGAFKILVALDKHHGERITGDVLVQEIGLSISAIESYSRPLREHKLILGFKGSGGGYQIAKRLDSITIDEFLNCVTKPNMFTRMLIKKAKVKTLADVLN